MTDWSLENPRTEKAEPGYDPAPRIAQEMQLSLRQVSNTLLLLSDGATVPFIARYRKEMTGGMDEVQIRDIRDRAIRLRELERRRLYILESIRSQDMLSPALEKEILQADTLERLEDLYLPYKPKRRTRATIAREKGLEPLARILMEQNEQDPVHRAAIFVNEEKGVKDVQEALAGARDIIAEWISEDVRARERLRQLFRRQANLQSKLIKGKDEEAEKYRDYYQYAEPLHKAPSHRVLAVLRGEREGCLRLHIAPPEEIALETLYPLFLKKRNAAATQVKMALEDAWKRLLQPSLENEMRGWAKEKAEARAINVFSENLSQLLMAPPLGQKRVLAIDPGFRTGCKLVCLDENGRLLHNETIYPHPPRREVRQAMHKILHLTDAYQIEAIAIGNGTAGRETEDLIRQIPFNRDIHAVIVSENGASVYSASDVARKEFPEYDVTVRGAVSIGRRLMDPLAELVKIDPKSIGVGQYQHDVDQTALKTSLSEVVESAVNAVGVEVNTASPHLLSYVSGLGPVLAENIVKHRDSQGAFRSRGELLKVARFGPRAFEQAAGFLRIRNGEHPLDASAVHPESYSIVEQMATDLQCAVADLIREKALREQIQLEKYVTEKIGMPTLQDIMKELEKPGRDPRQKFTSFAFDPRVRSIDDLKEGMELPGIVTNITAFGAFVDIGVHQDGLVHISEMAQRFIKDPNEVVKLHQQVLVKVIQVEVHRKRIQLSMKQAGDQPVMRSRQ